MFDNQQSLHIDGDVAHQLVHWAQAPLLGACTVALDSCNPCSDACLIPMLSLRRSHVKYALTASLWTRCMPQAAITTSALAAGRVMWLQPSAKALHPSICAALCQTVKLRYDHINMNAYQHLLELCHAQHVRLTFLSLL